MRTIKRKSHIEKIRKQHQSTKQRVQEILYLTDQSYCDYQFLQYCAFVETLAEGWPVIREQIMYSPHFRGFWNHEWAQRELNEFLPFAEDPESSLDNINNLQEYAHLHDHLGLLQSDEFMERYNNVLNIIRYA